jgi:RNA processing factor Prp31
MTLHRAALAATGMVLAGVMPALAAEPSNAELLERIERLEKQNRELEKALPGGRVTKRPRPQRNRSKRDSSRRGRKSRSALSGGCTALPST